MRNNLIFFTLALVAINCTATICTLFSVYEAQTYIINRNYGNINQPLSRIDIAEEIHLAKPGDTLILSYDNSTLYLGFYHSFIDAQPSDKLIILK